MSAAEAIDSALQNEAMEYAETRWSDSVSSAGINDTMYGGKWIGSRLFDMRERTIACAAEAAFQPIAEIGGSNGWYAWNYLWRIRGLMDFLSGGVGMRRGRPENRTLMPGDPLDFWRVEIFEPPYRMRLHAEMKLPGQAWLEFEVIPDDKTGMVTIRQTAVYYPRGLSGRLYWYSIYPVHNLVFNDLIDSIVERIAI